MIEVQITNFGEIIADLTGLPEKIQLAVRQHMETAIRDLWAKIVAHPAVAALEAKTGWNTLEHGVDQIGSATIGYVSPNDKGGGWYDIYPSKAKFLRFVTKSGTRVFTKHVFHPPFPMERYTQPEFDEALPFIEAGINAAIKEALES